jgi:hypothetical protein
VPQLNADTAASILDSAKFDVAAEDDGTKVLDSKLTSIAAFSGVSLSISGSVGANVLASGNLRDGFVIFGGAGLVVAASLFLFVVLKCFSGLRPKNFEQISQTAAAERVGAERLGEEPAAARARLATTYYLNILPKAREANEEKLDAVHGAYDGLPARAGPSQRAVVILNRAWDALPSIRLAVKTARST